MVATASGLKRTRTIRSLPTRFDPEAVTYVKFWLWNTGFGQIGAKASSLVGQFPTVPLPPAIAPAIRAEAKRQAREAILKKKEDAKPRASEEEEGKAGAVEEEGKTDNIPGMKDCSPSQADENQGK